MRQSQIILLAAGIMLAGLNLAAQEAQDSTAMRISDCLTSYRYDMALPLIGQAIAQAQDSLMLQGLYEQQAQCYKKLYNYSAALKSLSAANDIAFAREGMNLRLVTEMAECSIGAGNYEFAAANYMMLSRLVPDNPYYQIQLASVFYRAKDYRSAISQAARIYQSDSLNMPAINLVAGSYANLGDPGKAAEWYRRLYDLDRRDPQTVQKLCKSLMDSREFGEATAISGAFLVNVDPDNLEIWKLYAASLFLNGNHDESAKEFESILAAGDSTYNVRYYLGMSYQNLKQNTKAISNYAEAYRQDSTDVHLHVRYATTLAAAGITDMSDKLLSKAYHMIQPDSTLIYNILTIRARNAYLEYRFRDSLTFLSQARPYGKGDPDWYLMAYCHDMLHEEEKALEYYEKALAKAKPDSERYESISARIAYLKGELFMKDQL